MNEEATTDPAPPRSEAELVREAMEVLEGNWRGHETRPSPRLYPHQWSWDAAFVAIGYAHFDQHRAQEELRSLFRGQWSNGMLPHIVFSESKKPYFPGPDFWECQRSPFAPRKPRTSGILQPPIHATAARMVYERAVDQRYARMFLEELLPRLAAWHAFLRRERCRHDDGLIEIWHPWESGMDNSPLWDRAMARLVPRRVRSWVRADLQSARAAERPTDDDYARYIHLVELFRDHFYHPERIRAVTPFAIVDVLVNSLWVRANRDLAWIAAILGADPSPFSQWAAETAASMNSKLWDQLHAVYVDFDLVAGEPILTRVGAAFSPLYAGVPSEEQARRMVDGLVSHVGVNLDETTWMVPSFDPREPGFLPTNYWRGPIWVNVNWLLYRGLFDYGYTALARTLKQSLIELSRRSGFYEHYDPTTGRGHGAERFAWTAALVIDLLFENGLEASAGG
jgi:glycogen debranching enzyme